MPRYIITWNAGYGDNYAEVEALNKEAAAEMAYDEWEEEASNNADYDVIGEATDELREKYL